MSTLPAIFAIVIALLLGAISPGPSFVLISRISIAQSRIHGLAAALGMGVGGAIFAILALFGLIAALTQIAALYLILKVAGGLYLVWLAVKIWRGAAEPLPIAGPGNGKNQSLLRSFSSALFTQLSNPKTAIVYASIFAAMLPQSPPSWLFPVLPPLVFAIEAGWYAVVALAFSAPYPRAFYLSCKLWADRAAGTMMGLLGLRLVLDAIGLRRT